MGLDALLENQHGHWPKFQKLHIHSLSTPGASKLSLFSLYGQWFPRYGLIFKIITFGHEIWPLAKVSEVAHKLSFYIRGSKLSLFSLYGQWFPRYGLIFKIITFGHEIWPLAKFSEVAHKLSFYLRGPKLSLFSLYRPIFKNCHIWAWNLAIGQTSRSCMYTDFLPQGVKIELIFALRAVISEIGADFQICHIWAWNNFFQKLHIKLHIFFLNYP